MARSQKNSALSVVTAIKDVDNTLHPNLITPLWSKDLEPLLNVMLATLAFEPTKSGNKIFPLQEHLSIEYNKTKIQQIVFGKVSKSTKDFPFVFHMLLFTMGALCSGLPANYKFDYSSLMATAIGSPKASSL
jgi:hypothetical protein